MLTDPNAFNELAAAVGREAVIEILAALRESLEEVRRDLASYDADGIARKAHALKGSTSYLGTKALFELSVKADSAAKTGDTDAARHHLAELVACIDPSMAQIEAMVAQLPADA